MEEPSTSFLYSILSLWPNVKEAQYAEVDVKYHYLLQQSVGT